MWLWLVAVLRGMNLICVISGGRKEEREGGVGEGESGGGRGEEDVPISLN